MVHSVPSSGQWGCCELCRRGGGAGIYLHLHRHRIEGWLHVCLSNTRRHVWTVAVKRNSPIAGYQDEDEQERPKLFAFSNDPVQTNTKCMLLPQLTQSEFYWKKHIAIKIDTCAMLLGYTTFRLMQLRTAVLVLCHLCTTVSLLFNALRLQD